MKKRSNRWAQSGSRGVVGGAVQRWGIPTDGVDGLDGVDGELVSFGIRRRAIRGTNRFERKGAKSMPFLSIDSGDCWAFKKKHCSQW